MFIFFTVNLKYYIFEDLNFMSRGVELQALYDHG